MSKQTAVRHFIAAFVMVAIQASMYGKDDKELPFRGVETQPRLAGSSLSNTRISYVPSPSRNKLVMSGVVTNRPVGQINGFAIVNAADGKVMGIVPDGVKQIHFSPDGASFVTLGDTIKLWHTSTVKPWKELTVLDELKSPSVATFSSDGKMLAVIGDIDDFGKPKALKVVDLPSGKERWRKLLRKPMTSPLNGSGHDLKHLVASKTGALLFAQFGAWELLDFASGKVQSEFDDNILVNCDFDGSIFLCPDGHRFVHVPRIGGLRVDVWDIDRRKILFILDNSQSIVVSKVVSGGNRYAGVLVIGMRDGSVKMLDLKTLKVTDFGEKHQGAITAIDASMTKRIVVTGSEDYRIKIWDLETAQLLDTLVEDKAEVVTLAISPDGERIVSCCANSPVRIWNLK